MSEDKGSFQSICGEAQGVLTDPDCVKCMRQQLRATSMVVFFRIEDGWRLGNYQGDKPSSEAEIEFYCMLTAGVPQAVAGYEKGIILQNASQIEQVFPEVKELFRDSCVIAAQIKVGQTVGVRLAWRDADEPFTDQELELIKCTGGCPQGCAPIVV